MRRIGILLQIFGGSMCAVAGIAGSFSFERYVKQMMAGGASARDMDAMIMTGLEYAVVALVATAAGAFLIFYGARVARHAVTAGESTES